MEETSASPVLMEPLLTSSELCQLLRIDRPRLYALMESGVLRGIRLGRRWRFAPADVRAFIEMEDTASRQGGATWGIQSMTDQPTKPDPARLAWDWEQRAVSLGQWCFDYLVNRIDVWGKYKPLAQRGEETALTAPKLSDRGRVTLNPNVLARHFRLQRPTLRGHEAVEVGVRAIE